VTIAVCLVHKVPQVRPGRTAFQVHLGNQETLATPASLRQSVCHQPHRRANLARQDPLDHLASPATKDPPDSLETRDHQAKMLNQAPQDHQDHLALPASLDPSDHPVTQVNQPKAHRPAQEMPDHLALPARKDHLAQMATLAPMDNQAAQGPKVHQVPQDQMETLAQMDSPVAKDHPANKESLAFVPNIVRWMVECFSKTGYADRRSIEDTDQQPSDCSSLFYRNAQHLLLTFVLITSSSKTFIFH